MVKFKPVRENPIRECLSYILSPFLNITSTLESKQSHRYKRTKSARNISNYFNRFVIDSTTKQTYRLLEFLHENSMNDFEEQKKQGVVLANLHPLAEKNWFIDYLKPRIEGFSSDDIWQVMLNNGHREKYTRFLMHSESVSRLEMFIENCFFAALPEHMLVEIFLMACEGEGVEQEEKLNCLLTCLCHHQAAALLQSLQKTIKEPKHWFSYCQKILNYMRNSQIKNVIHLLPTELENSALEKLYPYEIIEVLENTENPKDKETIINKVLSNRKKWWETFPHDEVKHALSVLQSL